MLKLAPDQTNEAYLKAMTSLRRSQLRLDAARRYHKG
jgi:hypothetical protein